MLFSSLEFADIVRGSVDEGRHERIHVARALLVNQPVRWSLVIGRASLEVVCRWSFVVGRSWLVVHCWSFIIRRWSLVVSLVVR